MFKWHNNMKLMLLMILEISSWPIQSGLRYARSYCCSFFLLFERHPINQHMLRALRVQSDTRLTSDTRLSICRKVSYSWEWAKDFFRWIVAFLVFVLFLKKLSVFSTSLPGKAHSLFLSLTQLVGFKIFSANFYHQIPRQKCTHKSAYICSLECILFHLRGISKYKADTHIFSLEIFNIEMGCWK